jgi:hypothetical protein
LKELEIGHAIAPGDAGRSKPGNVYRNLDAVARLGQHGKPGHVVAVLVGDQDRSEGLRGYTDPFQALEGVLAAQAGVNQETSLRGRQQRGVSSTGRREYPAFNYKVLPK